jgi:hypothetical protein
VSGPSAEEPAVQAWADDYIRFERLPAWQTELRSEIRRRVRQLEAAPEQVLVATFFGPKRSNADVENLVLYNVDAGGTSFAPAARFGLRFEHGAVCPRTPSGSESAYSYRYELAPRRTGLRDWVDGRELAAWDWVDLGAFSGAKKLEQVWLALARAPVRVASPSRAAATPFAVRASIRPPLGGTAPNLGALVKGVFDGVVCAFQAHMERASAPELAARVSRHVPADPADIEALLVDRTRAVLGTVPRLLHRRGDGVIWAPSDDLCVAGELLAVTPVGSGWAIKGSIVELEPR